MHCPPKCAWGVGALLHLGQRNPLQKCTHHPKNCIWGWESSCIQVDATLYKNAYITPQNCRGGAGRELSHAWINAMLCKNTCITPEIARGRIFVPYPPAPLGALVQPTPPPSMQNCITGVGACALLLIAGFKPKKGREKVEKTDFGGQNSLSACNTVASSLPPPPPAQGSHP